MKLLMSVLVASFVSDRRKCIESGVESENKISLVFLRVVIEKSPSIIKNP